LSRTFVVLCAVIASAALVACTSSSKPKQTPLGSTSAPSTLTTPATTPTPSPTTTVPLSPFEDDPAVKALRTWASLAAKAVNAGGRFTDPALRQVMTPAFAKNMQYVLGTDIGLYYPGPVPFLPLSVRAVNSTVHAIQACFVSTGFAQKPATHKAAEPRSVVAVDVRGQLVAGVWKVSQQQATSAFSCKTARVAMPTW